MHVIGFHSLPNLITIGRLVLVPVIVVMILEGHWGSACALFILAGLSDAVDGWLARTFDLRTQLGAYLDPLADKALLVSMTIALAAVGLLPSFLAVLIVGRDGAILAAILVSWARRRPIAIRPLFISKLNTAAQIIVITAVLALRACVVSGGMWIMAGFYAVATLTLLSTAAYLVQWRRHMSI